MMTSGVRVFREQMTPAEREAHMLKKKEELRLLMKKKFAESRRVGCS